MSIIIKFNVKNQGENNQKLKTVNNSTPSHTYRLMETPPCRRALDKAPPLVKLAIKINYFILFYLFIIFCRAVGHFYRLKKNTNSVIKYFKFGFAHVTYP